MNESRRRVPTCSLAVDAFAEDEEVLCRAVDLLVPLEARNDGKINAKQRAGGGLNLSPQSIHLITNQNVANFRQKLTGAWCTSRPALAISTRSLGSNQRSDIRAMKRIN